MAKTKAKFFVFGDIHSFYKEFKEELDKTDYDPENPNHCLISLGDNFDRGPQSQEMLDFLIKAPTKILIRGNHEDLLLQCIDRGFPKSHDISNGTVRTLLDLGGVQADFNNPYIPADPKDYNTACYISYVKVYDFIHNMDNYFETENFIFTHSWLPVEKDENGEEIYQENWREAHSYEWYNARWGNPYVLAEKGLNKTGKNLVFGHWHTSWWRHHINGEEEFGENSNFDSVVLKEQRCIGIDACTVYSHQVNILTIEDYLLDSDNYV